MRPRTRLVALLAAGTSVVAGALAADALGAAGGGSGGFSGGGGGGGGSGFGGGGSGSGSNDPMSWLVTILFFAVVVTIVLLVERRKRRRKAGTWDPAVAAERDRETRDARRARAERIAGASLVAAEDDPYFASDVVVPQAEQLFRDIQSAWDARDEEALARMVGPELLVEWSRRLADFARKGWHNRVDVDGPVTIEYVGLVNREDDDEDRVIVRVSATLDDRVIDGGGRVIRHSGRTSTETSIREYWTLRQHEGRWILASIEQDEEGEHHLRSDILADPADDSAWTDDALVEHAVSNRLQDGVALSQVADLDFDGDALTAARDLSLVDQRFDPGVIEVAVRRAIAAWAEAVDGPDDALLEMADPRAVRSLLYPADDGVTRLVVRGPRVLALRVTGLDAAATPAEVHVEADVEGVRFLENRDTVVVVAGNNREPSRFTERWTLALDDDSRETPWRIAEAVPEPV